MHTHLKITLASGEVLPLLAKEDSPGITALVEQYGAPLSIKYVNRSLKTTKITETLKTIGTMLDILGPDAPPSYRPINFNDLKIHYPTPEPNYYTPPKDQKPRSTLIYMDEITYWNPDEYMRMLKGTV